MTGSPAGGRRSLTRWRRARWCIARSGRTTMAALVSRAQSTVMAGSVQDVESQHPRVASGSDLTQSMSMAMADRAEVSSAGPGGCGARAGGGGGRDMSGTGYFRTALSSSRVGISVANSGVGPAMVIAFPSEEKSRVVAWLLETRVRSRAMRARLNTERRTW